MSLYRIWNPCMVSPDPPMVGMFLTYGEFLYIGTGTDRMMAGLLRELQIDSGIVRWSMTRYRCSYFATYPDSSDWHDRWPSTWKIEVELDRVPAAIATSDDGMIAVDVVDDSWSRQNNAGSIEAAPCLVLADFEDLESLERAQRAVKTRVSDVMVIGVTPAMGSFHQLQMSLGHRPGSFYRDEAPDAEVVRTLCERLGGSMNARTSYARKAARRGVQG